MDCGIILMTIKLYVFIKITFYLWNLRAKMCLWLYIFILNTFLLYLLFYCIFLQNFVGNF